MELELRADDLDEQLGPSGRTDGTGVVVRPPLGSVYLGGGTPSLLAGADVAALLARIERRFGLATDAEVTIEANPGPDERGDLAGFRAAGVTRVSFGAQSFDPGELRRLGRRHRPRDTRDALEAARRAGIAHRSLDLLYDVPGQTTASWRASVEQGLGAPIDHLSAYALTLDVADSEGPSGIPGVGDDRLPVRPGARRWRLAARAEQDDDRAADAYLWLDERLAAAGFAWYEVSNWARPGGASRHNLAYWQRRATLGVGPGAHAFDGARRRTWNAARLDGYLAALLPTDGSPPRLPPGGEEVLDGVAERLERISLGLRTRQGLARDELSAGAMADAASAIGAGLVERTDGDRIALTARGRLLAGELAGRLSG